jgi:hypothetical protein
LQFQRDGGSLRPGEVLGCYPPFCAQESAEGVHLFAVSCEEGRRFRADLAAQLRNLPDGARIEFRITNRDRKGAP